MLVHFTIIGLSFEAGSFPEPGARLEASNTQDCVSVHHSLGHRLVVFCGFCDPNSVSAYKPLSVALALLFLFSFLVIPLLPPFF